MSRIRETDGASIYLDSELSEDERFALGLVRVVHGAEITAGVDWVKADKLIANNRDVRLCFPLDDARHHMAPGAGWSAIEAEIRWTVYFHVWFHHEFGVVFPGDFRRWGERYKSGLDRLVEKGIVADLVKASLPGAASASECWVPRRVWLDRVEPSPVEWKEG